MVKLPTQTQASLYDPTLSSDAGKPAHLLAPSS